MSSRTTQENKRLFFEIKDKPGPCSVQQMVMEFRGAARVHSLAIKDTVIVMFRGCFSQPEKNTYKKHIELYIMPSLSSAMILPNFDALNMPASLCMPKTPISTMINFMFASTKANSTMEYVDL